MEEEDADDEKVEWDEDDGEDEGGGDEDDGNGDGDGDDDEDDDDDDETNASSRSRRCILASQVFAVTHDVCGNVHLSRALYNRVRGRFLYKHKQVLSLVYWGQHGFPKSESKRQGIFTSVLSPSDRS